MLFLTIQFSISHLYALSLNVKLWPVDNTTPGQSGRWSDDSEGVHQIPQSSIIIGASPSDCLMSSQDIHRGEGLTTLQRYSRLRSHFLELRYY